MDHPTPSNIRWVEVQALMRAIDVEIVEGSGSRVRLRKGEVTLVVHSPHPNPEMGRRAVRGIAKFLNDIGVYP